MSKQDQLAWEARWARPAALCAFFAGVFLLAQIVLLQAVVDDREEIEPLADFLLSVDDQPSLLLASRGAQAIGTLLLIPVFLYLFRAVRARQESIPAFFIYLVVGGPLLLALGLILGAVDQVGIAEDFAAGTPIQGDPGADRAERLLEDNANAVLFAFSFAGTVATAFLFVMIPLRARRVGLLSPFMGVLGVVAGALLVLRLVPLVPEIIQAFWLGALGSLYLGNWPGGRGPAWETGEVEPWPSAAQRRGVVAKEDGEGAPRDSLLDPSEPVESEPEAEPSRPSSRKRKRR